MTIIKTSKFDEKRRVSQVRELFSRCIKIREEIEADPLLALRHAGEEIERLNKVIDDIDREVTGRIGLSNSLAPQSEDSFEAIAYRRTEQIKSIIRRHKDDNMQ